jgi:hypothetical protein
VRFSFEVMMGYSKPIEPDCDQPAAARAKRAHRMLNVLLRSPRFGTVAAMARNVSPGGMGGSTRQWLAAGEEIEVELPNIGWVPASVAWTDGIRFGLSFAGEIDAARVTRDAAAGRDREFQVMDRFRPDTSSRRPGLGIR